MESPKTDTWGTIQSVLNKGFDKARDYAGQANQAMVNKGITPLGGAALATGAIGSAMLLKHLLSREETPRVYYR